MVAVKFRGHKNTASDKPKIVHLLSMAHKLNLRNTNKTDRDDNIIKKPSCVIDYNYNMGGVNMVDQQLDGIDVLMKSYKWYKKLFFRLVMQYMLASHKLYKKQGGREDFLMYVLEVCTLLLLNTLRLGNPPGRPPVDNIFRLTGRNHWPGKKGITRVMDQSKVQN